VLAVHEPSRHNGCVITEAGLAPAVSPAELELARLAVRIGADQVAGWSQAEQDLADAAGSGRDLADAAGSGHDCADAAGLPAVLAGLADVASVRAQIRAGADPLGEAFCRLRPATRRRSSGQTFTPAPVVAAMVGWAAGTLRPARVVDPGTGSARFLAAAGDRWPAAILIGVETDPLAAMIGRATLAAAGLGGRSAITLGDYRSLSLPPVAGPTLFLGNPPYVRHHQIPASWKQWLKTTAADHGLAASGLAGLHVHFLLATAGLARPGDAGVLITAAEWLDVNYGALARALLLGPLGGQSIQLLDPTLPVFSDAVTTAAISCFRPGSRPASLRLRLVTSLADLADLATGGPVPRTVLAESGRWTPLFAGPAALPPAGQPAGACQAGRPGQASRAGQPDQQVPAGPAGAPEAGPAEAGPAEASPARAGPAEAGPARAGLAPADLARAVGGHQARAMDQVELGELCRVHRGQVTGANSVWITAGNPAGLPSRFLFPAVTHARELFAAHSTLASVAGLRLVIDLPADLGELTASELAVVARFLARAEVAGAAGGYIARHRTPWWRVRLGGAAPILATYMARRPPAFVRNLAGARHVNIAHGLYPREPLPAAALDGLAAYLRRSVTTGQGRTYAGGLTKFEPGELERLLVPAPSLLPLLTPPATYRANELPRGPV
jgi:adenine-specific DNA-methyltransferase